MIDTSKLCSPISTTRINVVLVLNGCFNPIHRNHVHLLEVAKAHLITLNDYHVLGGYVSPTHDAGIERKLSVLHATWQDRLEMCRLAVKDSSWIMIDDWQISREKNHGAQQSKQHLMDCLRQLYSSLQIISICGGDALPKFMATFKRELVVCIINRSIDQFEFDPWFQSASIKPYHRNIIVIYDHQTTRSMSSTSIRQRISQNLYESLSDDLHPAVLDYHRRQKIVYRSSNETIVWSDFGPDERNSLMKELGHGRCATVYAGQYRNRSVAVKIIRERKQFQHESNILLVLSRDTSYHDNLIRIFGIGDQFCVMEKCDTDLLTYLKEHRVATNQTLTSSFPDQHWLQWVQQMLNGFVHLMSLGILHRDIKTDNILLCNRIAKIADFSVSIDIHNRHKMPLRGSIRHYAPEAIEEKKIYTEKADVYMFGCLLYEIVHGGERIWPNINTHAVVERRLNSEIPMVTGQCQAWYTSMIIDECWLYAADQRSTFEQLRQIILSK
jgi:nicotinate (nicotinamide) nucleotide adenylyltransferase